MNMVVKYIVHMHITAELKAYWLSCICKFVKNADVILI